MSIEKIYQDQIPIRRIYLNGEIVWEAKGEPVRLPLSHIAEHIASCMTDLNASPIQWVVPSYGIDLAMEHDSQYVSSALECLSGCYDQQISAGDESLSGLTVIDLSFTGGDVTELFITDENNALTVCDVISLFEDVTQSAILDESLNLFVAESKRAGYDNTEYINDNLDAHYDVPLAVTQNHTSDLCITLACQYTAGAGAAVFGACSYVHDIHQEHLATAMPGYGVALAHKSDIDIKYWHSETGVAGLAAVASHLARHLINCDDIVTATAAWSIHMAHDAHVSIQERDNLSGTLAEAKLARHSVNVAVESVDDGWLSKSPSAQANAVYKEIVQSQAEHNATIVDVRRIRSSTAELFDHDSAYDLTSIRILSVGCDSVCRIASSEEAYISDRPDLLYPEQDGTSLYIPQVFSATRNGTDLYLS